jgi:TorA maturation chaperone TorD
VIDDMKKGNAETVLSPEDCRALARIRADLYSLLSSAYLHIPATEMLERGWKPAVDLLRFPREENKVALQSIDRGLNLIRPYGSGGRVLEEKTLTNLSRDWTRLFRGVEKEGILPPYESLYRTGKLQEKPSREIHRLFSHMGIRVPDEWHQPPDYIGVELDFMRLLCSRELEAYEKQETKALSETLHEEQAFVENHLGAWVPQFCEKMFSEAREDFFRGIAHLTTGFIAYDRFHTKSRASGVPS